MKALIFDRVKTLWEKSRGFIKADVPKPKLGHDDDAVIVKVYYAGVCGSDKGIWYRQAFRDQILGSLAAEQKSFRITGHEFCGEIIEAGVAARKKYGLAPGQFVSSESHVVCNRCFQCLHGQKNVCANEKILGISYDGCFAEFIKVPGHIVWPTNLGKIRPEVAALQEPFGNAVHAASKTSLKGKTVALFGLGPIGLFTALIARGLGARTVIGVDPKPETRRMAKFLGIDAIYNTSLSPSYRADKILAKKILNFTNGLGTDVSFELSGSNAALNTAVFVTRRGGDVILFGIKAADFTLQDYNRLIVRGLTLHAVIGRELWQTWEITRRLLENPKNKIQSAIYETILHKGKNTILPIDDFSPKSFEETLGRHPKFLIKF